MKYELFGVSEYMTNELNILEFESLKRKDKLY